MSNSELFYLKWNNFQKNVRRMRDEEDLIDITFACEGKKIGAHKLVLFSCSPYFKDLLKDNKSQHPIFFFHDISYDILKAILEYMYLGEVHITNDNLKDFIRVAEALQIRGLSKDTSTTDETFNESNASDIIDENNFIRKRTGTDEHNIQTYTTSGKRLRIISEASLATALNEEDDEIEEEPQQVRITAKRSDSHNLQPKVESLEFLDEAAHHIQQAQQQTSKQPQNITYMNMDSFTEKTNTVTNQPQQQQQPPATQYVQAGTSQLQTTTDDYKSEDDIWVEKAIDIGSASQSETSPKTRSANKNSAAYKANCLTPRSCPVCARVYSNVSNLRQHMRLIHNPQAVVCPICQKHFNSDLYLKRHYASIHSINNTSGSETEGVEKTTPTTNTSATNSGNNWSYQNNSVTDGTILQQ